jgi:hypothetical protein
VSNLNRYLPWVLILILAALAYFSWRDARNDLSLMRTTIEAQEHVIAESKRAMADNQQKLTDSLAEIERQRKQVRTPEQAARAIPQVIPGVTPTIVELPHSEARLEPQDGPASSLPDSSRGDAEITKKAEIPLDQLKTLYDFAQDCKACTLKLEAAEVDKRELLIQLAAAEKQKTAAIHAAQGGSFLVRLKRDSKQALGAGAGAAAGAAICSKSDGPVIAACAGIGALTGFVVSKL